MFAIQLFLIVCITILECNNAEIFPTITMGDSNSLSNETSTNCPYMVSTLIAFNTLYNASSTSVKDIHVDNSSHVLISQATLPADSEIINRITVHNGSVLVFNDSDIELHVREIVVDIGGRLVIGTESCRYQEKIKIVFHGSKADSSPSAGNNATSKGILARGVVDIHGSQYHPTWTRLSSTLSAGDTVLYLQDSVNWKVGQRVVIMPTVYHDCPDHYAEQFCLNEKHQNEIRTITAVGATAGYPSVVSLDAAVRHDHYAGAEYQAEVALLDRNILLVGQESNDSFGGHTQIMGEHSEGRFSGVHATNMGQLNVMGRYPFHFHMMGNASSRSSFFQDCLVTNSHFRGYTIHGSNHTRASRNVAFNVTGSCYYLEDGVEEYNLLEYNLAAHVHPISQPADGGWGQGGEIFYQSESLIIPADTSAAGFYISNANNWFIGNCASGGWSGYAFPNIPARLGAYKGTLPPATGLNPMNRPILKFFGNTAHSSGAYWRGHGSCIYTGAWLEYDSNGQLVYNSGRKERLMFVDGARSYRAMLFENTKVFLCNKGISHWGDNSQFEGVEVYDARVNMMLFGKAYVHSALWDMNTQNPGNRILYYSEHFGFTFYDTWVQTVLSNITIRNTDDVNAVWVRQTPVDRYEQRVCALRLTDHSDQFLPQGINAIKDIQFINVSDEARLCINHCGEECRDTAKPTMASKMQNIWDYDGSISGSGYPTIVGSNIDWWNADDSCFKSNTSFLWNCPWLMEDWGIDPRPSMVPELAALVHNHTVGYIMLRVEGLDGGCAGSHPGNGCAGQNANYTVGRLSHWGEHSSTRYIDMSPWPGVSGMTNMGWHYRATAASYGISGAPSLFTLGEYYQLSRGSFIVLSIAYPPGTVFTVGMQYYGHTLPLVPMSNLSTVLLPTEDLKHPDDLDCTNLGHWSHLCKDTGGGGFSWHFDGRHLYLRIVPFECYSNNQRRGCRDRFYEADGIKVWNIVKGYTLTVNATCTGCDVQSSIGGVEFYDVPDTVPADNLREMSALAGIQDPPSDSPTTASTANSAPSNAPWESTRVFDLTSMSASDGYTIRGGMGRGWTATTVSSAGDINADGHDDLIIGACGHDNYVVYGKGTKRAGLNLTKAHANRAHNNAFRVRIPHHSSGGDGDAGTGCGGVAERMRTGFLSNVGDVDSDGHDDFVVGHSTYSRVQSDAGITFVVRGKRRYFKDMKLGGARTRRHVVQIHGASAGDLSGYAVSGAGDVDGDGIPDILIGAPGASPYNRTHAGIVYVVHGSRFTANPKRDFNLADLDKDSGFRILGLVGSRLGTSAARAGDINADGTDDVIVSVCENASVAAVYVIYGHVGGTSTVDLSSFSADQGFKITIPAASDHQSDACTGSVSAAGDVNGDGIADVIIGGFRTKSAWVVFGGSGVDVNVGTMEKISGFEMYASVGGRVGYSVSTAGDFNGDGFADVIIGAPAGAGHFRRRLDLDSMTMRRGVKLLAPGRQSTLLGYSVSAAGDVNSDGYEDVVVAAPVPEAGSRVGLAFVVYGRKNNKLRN